MPRSEPCLPVRRKKGGKISDEALAEIYQKQVVATRTLLAHLQFHGEAEVMEVSYQGALENPAAVAKRLSAFLGEGFDEKAAVMAVDASLYRSKSC